MYIIHMYNLVPLPGQVNICIWFGDVQFSQILTHRTEPNTGSCSIFLLWPRYSHKIPYLDKKWSRRTEIASKHILYTKSLKVWEVRHMKSIICEPYRQMCLYKCVMVDHCEPLAVTTHLLTWFIWFALPGFEPSTLGSVSSNPTFYH